MVHHETCIISLMCLFGGETRRMENFGEKIGGKTFLECVWMSGEKGNKWWGLGIFSPGPPKCFLSKMERKLSED